MKLRPLSPFRSGEMSSRPAFSDGVPALLATPLLLIVTSCGKAPSDSASPESPAGRATAPTADGGASGASPELRSELLDMAFRAASAIPVHPHVKDRSLAQQWAVDACLELDQSELARRFIPRIEGWRRGVSWADLAIWKIEHGQTGEVEQLLDFTDRVALETARQPNQQEWRIHRVRDRLAQARMRLDRYERTGTAAPRVDDKGFETIVAALERAAANGEFESIQTGLDRCMELYDTDYEDSERRSRIEAVVDRCTQRIPLDVRVERFFELARVAIDHGDRDRGLELVRKVQPEVETADLANEHGIRLLANLAAMQHRAGDEDAAQFNVNQAEQLFADHQREIVVPYRVRSLLPVAEAYQVLGDAEDAARVYRQVVFIGSDNPNARPRAMDLARVCSSMAVHGFDPGAELRATLGEILAGLDEPW